MAAALCCGCGAGGLRAGGAAALAAIPLLLWVAPRWDAAARARLWRGFNVVGARETIYGNLTVTETGENGSGTIRSIYENGAILANAPDPAAAEEAVDYALLEHAAPRRVLLIGGGVNGGVAEALKHPTVERLDYVELDPALIGMAREYFPAQTADFDSDSRVHLHFLDGRRYLAGPGERFDVIIVDVPDPQTAQLNRFYTVEFFRRRARNWRQAGCWRSSCAPLRRQSARIWLSFCAASGGRSAKFFRIRPRFPARRSIFSAPCSRMCSQATRRCL